MEKRCEFCRALRPIVYCKSDAAHLCLSCDAKVHSANALSYRHPRTLVCESCSYHPSLVRCFDHDMFMCQSCDSIHHASFEHRRKVVTCYVGCPSAKELALLWGFDFNQLENNSVESDGGSSNGETKKKSSSLILQQILDLEKLQLSESSDDSLVKGQTPLRHDTVWKEDKTVDDDVEYFSGDVDKSEEGVSSPFSQLDNLTNNTGESNSFWQYKSPLHNNEIWLQNMQDLGVCDEVQCFDDDDVNIPDVDLTFRNFEELFGSEQDRGFTRTVEESNDVFDKEIDAFRHEVGDPRPIRSSYSTSSRITGESSGYECNKDDGLYPTFYQQGKENAVRRYKEKKVLMNEKQGNYTSQRSRSDFKKRGRSQVLKAEAESGNATRSL